MQLKSLARSALKVWRNAGGRRKKKVLIQLEQFKRINDGRFEIAEDDLLLCLNDNTNNTWFDSHYIYHPAWAARIVKQIAPAKHVDIGSTLHFCSMLSAFVETDFYDYRPAVLNLSKLNCAHADLTDLPFKNDSIESLSCLHTIEHIGLGRYGDPIDPTADLKAITELKRVCQKGGHLLIVVPVGRKKLQFNAHRIYDPTEIENYMDGFTLANFAWVDDQGSYQNDAKPITAKDQDYGCGCYHFIKN